MIHNGKRYCSLDYELKKQFNKKVVKLSLDGGFTCPTRDGSKGYGGCIFCSGKGSGEFAGIIDKDHRKYGKAVFQNDKYEKPFSNLKQQEITKFIESLQIKEQIQSQKQLLNDKWKDVKYIAYFQNFTNTYASKGYLVQLYEKALEDKDIVGLAIATRADCIDDEILQVLHHFNKKTFLFVEIGLQSIHEDTAKFIRRGYELEEFEKAVSKLYSIGIKTVVHTIVGLPNEDRKKILQTYKYLSKMDIWGIKIAQLNILKNTDLAKYYEENPFYIMDKDEYIDIVIDIIGLLRKDIVIHRLTGDGAKQDLIEPKWILNKRYVLNGIDKKLKEKNITQGENAE